MIIKEQFYGVECDNCSEIFEDFSGISFRARSEDIVEDVKECEWHVDGEKHYCKNCFHVDDDDNVIIHEKPNN